MNKILVYRGPFEGPPVIFLVLSGGGWIFTFGSLGKMLNVIFVRAGFLGKGFDWYVSRI